MMTKHCQGLDGGRPVIVNVQKRDLGTVVIGNGQSTTNFSATATDSPYATNVSGVARTHSSGSMSGLRNYNQEIMFKCVSE